MGKQSKNRFVCAGIERGLPLFPMAEAMGNCSLRWIPAYGLASSIIVCVEWFLSRQECGKILLA
jgi:hypothetical protein